jgi:Dolichyl-phosphate-mannose-protein mannosyltransferase
MIESVSNQRQSFFGPSRWVRILVLLVMFAAALAIRVYDITDLPLDFQPTRQLYTAILARGRYYEQLTSAPQEQRNLAIGMWRIEGIESPVFDSIAAFSYEVVGQEILWLPRLESAIIWVLGGIFLYLLARDMTSVDGGLVAVAFYWFVPYGIIASRAFMPDPLTTALSIITWWGLYRWYLKRSWKWVVVCGLAAGLAIFTKALAVFPIFGGFLGILIARGFRKSFTDLQFWAMGALTAIPTTIYTIYGFFVQGGLGSDFALRFFPQLWIDPVFYLRWEGMLESVIGLAFFVAALVGIFLYETKEKRLILISHWIAYVIFALIFAYYFSTHDYYHIALVPVVGLSLAPLGEVISSRLRQLNPGKWLRIVIVACLVFGVAFDLWNVRNTFHKTDYRPQLAYWQHIGSILQHHSTTALTQDYGYRLEYFGWIEPAAYWPYTGDTALRLLAGMKAPEFDQQFQELTHRSEFFLITDLNELNNQPQLKDYLQTHYPIYDQGTDYLIYDLRKPLPAATPSGVTP